MQNLFKLLILVPLLALPACNGEGEGDGPPAQPARVELGRQFEIGYGKTVLVEDIAIEFTSVIEESRCPIDAVCVWGGNARILVTANRGNITRVLELGLWPQAATIVVFEGRVIEFRDLHPYPASVITQPLPQSYVATLSVDGLVTVASP
jgi:hypothetical protein